MGISDFFGRWLGNSDGTISLTDAYIYELSVEAFYKRLAIETSINMISNALTRAKFVTYEKGKPKRGETHYLFNVAPNVNQNATEFIHQWVSNLVYDNEALVVQVNDQLHVADSWEVEPFALKENIYKGVNIGNLTLDRAFNESEVFHFKLNNNRIASVLDGLYESYGKILAAGMANYKRSNAIRMIFEIQSSMSMTQKDQEARENFFGTQLESFFKAENGAGLPLPKGINAKEVKSSSGNTTSSRDVRALVDDVFDMVAMAFHIPKGLLKGDLAEVDSQVDTFLMFCVNPIAELMNDEINRKMYTKNEYLARTYLRVDTTMIKYVDPTALANAADKLVSSAALSVNEVREKLLGEEPIAEAWADEHFITKNYQEVKDYLENGPAPTQPLKGGETN